MRWVHSQVASWWTKGAARFLHGTVLHSFEVTTACQPGTVTT